MPFQIAVLRGDGIGPEVTEQAVRVLETVGRVYGHTFIFREGIVGGVAIDRYGTPLPASVLEMCRGVHGVLFGAVGGPKWDDLRAAVHPEEAIFGLRKELRLYANLRPIHVYPELAACSPVKDVAGVDILFVRELTGGLYYGKPKRRWETPPPPPSPAAPGGQCQRPPAPPPLARGGPRTDQRVSRGSPQVSPRGRFRHA